MLKFGRTKLKDQMNSCIRTRGVKKSRSTKRKHLPHRYGTVGEDENKTPANLGLAVCKPALPHYRAARAAPRAGRRLRGRRQGRGCAPPERGAVRHLRPLRRHPPRRHPTSPSASTPVSSPCRHPLSPRARRAVRQRFLMREMGMLSHLLVCGSLLGDGSIGW
jgi:hypothetical protein